MVDFFIHRPVFATVCALLIVLAGAVCIPTLPISLYPTLAPPQVTVTANYVGANAQTVEAAVTTPLEEAINGVEGMQYISSTSSNDGTSSIVTTFRTGYNLDIAAVDVQNRVASASGQLPAEVNSSGITITKSNSNFVFGAAFLSPHHSYSNLFISNYLDVYVANALKRLPGVGNVMIFGEREYAMRIWLDPAKLAARGLTASDVISAIQEQNNVIPAGQVGEPPANEGQVFQIPVRVIGRLVTPQQFDNIVLKSTPNGIVQLKDVGYAQLGAQTYASTLRYNGQEAVGIGVQQLSDANALTVDREAKAELAKLAKNFPPDLTYVIPFDTTTVIGDSIRDVVTTLVEAIIIVIVVIFFFLLDWRATLIPAITIPVSLVGTFIFIKAFGFSINSLTMFGIILATGLVVDDAIVVIENVQRHIAADRSEPHRATSVAMREVTGAVVATSLVLISVFVPVSFFPGTTGILYRQFALTIAFSIAISAFNALTLSPSLAALFLRGEGIKHGLFGLIDRGVHGMTVGYEHITRVLLRFRYAVLLVFLVALAATVYVYTHVPKAFVPDEDQSLLMCVVQAPPGASLSYTNDLAQRAVDIIRKDKDVSGTFAVMGFSMTSGSAPNAGLIFVALKDINKRVKEGPGHSAAAILAKLSPELQRVPGGIIQLFPPPAIEGIGSFGGFQFELQQTGGGSIQELARVAHEIMGAARSDKKLTGVFTSFTANDPELLVTIDRSKAKALGVPLDQISSTLSTFMGSDYVNNFTFNERSYRVYVQAQESARMSPSDLTQFYVRSNSGDMIPLDNLVTITQTSAPQVISHYNLFRSAEIDGSAAPGVSSGEGLKAMEQLAEKYMTRGMQYEWTGLALEQIKSSGKAILIFGLGLVVVYLTLSALYESFALPFIILLAVPTAVLGALGFVIMRGKADDVYCQIGLVLLIGLAAKNSILIVEFAEQIRDQGKSIVEAAIEASALRLRPILMTSFAFILGVVPLYVAKGAGAMGQQSVGTVIVGGMLVSTILNLFFIPALYVILQSLLGRFSPKKKKPVAEETATA